MRASRGLKWENKMYKLKRSISAPVQRTTRHLNKVPFISFYISSLQYFWAEVPKWPARLRFGAISVHSTLL